MGLDMNEQAFKLGKAFALGFAFSRGANCAGKIAMDAQRWITVFPNGRQNEGRPALIDSDTGKVLGGMGGKFNGTDIRKTRKEFHNDEPKKNEKLKKLLDEGKLWEKGDYSRTYLNPKAAAEFLGIKFKMHPKKRNIPESVETGDPDRRFTPSAANDLYRALEDVYFDNKSKKFVLPTGLRNMRGWLPEWLEKRFQDAMK